MSSSKLLNLLVLAVFVVFSAWVVATGGSLGEVVAIVTANPWTVQISVDLVLALSLVSIWLWRDARRRGRNPLPWLVATLLTGSIAPLTYLLLRPEAGPGSDAPLERG